jgi:murein DD-endopeptidase MepM/ murein hydrolase activator NlpD
LFVRQRLSSEPDRYRGRRRVPTPPRSRYAVVGVSAFVAAGGVALASASHLPDAKAVNPKVLASLQNASAGSSQLTERQAKDPAASRGEDRGTAKTKAAAQPDAADIWVLPLETYTYSSPFGVRFGKLHAGIDLAGPDGTPYKAIHAGTVTTAGYYGGYGYMITVKNPDGTETIYAHSRRLLVKKGDQVKAGQPIGELGNSGASYGTHLHLEIHVDGTPIDPIGYLRDRGVDIKLQVESIYAGMAEAS